MTRQKLLGGLLFALSIAPLCGLEARSSFAHTWQAAEQPVLLRTGRLPAGTSAPVEAAFCVQVILPDAELKDCKSLYWDAANTPLAGVPDSIAPSLETLVLYGRLAGIDYAITALERFVKLRRLGLRVSMGTRGAELLLKAIARMQFLAELDLTIEDSRNHEGAWFNHSEFVEIASAKGLQALRIAGARYLDLTSRISELSINPSVQRLDVELSHTLSLVGFAYVRIFPNLHDLALSWVGLDVLMSAGELDLTKLRNLEISVGGIRSLSDARDCFECLGALSSLADLSIKLPTAILEQNDFSGDGGVALKLSPNFARLRHFKLNCPLATETLRALSVSSRELLALDLPVCSISQVDQIAKMESLIQARLSLCEAQSSESWVAGLRHSRVVSLELSVPRVSDALLSAISEIQRINDLRINFTGFASEYASKANISDKGLIALSKLENLRSLEIPVNGTTTSNGWKRLASLRNLMILRFDPRDSLDDESWKEIASFPFLQHLLVVFSARNSAVAIEAVSAMKRLLFLELVLRSTPDDEVVASINKSVSLRALSIRVFVEQLPRDWVKAGSKILLLSENNHIGEPLFGRVDFLKLVRVWLD